MKEDRDMATGAEVSTAVSDAEIPDRRSVMLAVSEPDRSASSLISWWLVVIPLGCLLMAMVCAEALSRFVPLPVPGSGRVSVEEKSEDEPDLLTIYEVQGEGSLLSFGPALAR
jgi:hypothetical protein